MFTKLVLSFTLRGTQLMCTEATIYHMVRQGNEWRIAEWSLTEKTYELQRAEVPFEGYGPMLAAEIETKYSCKLSGGVATLPLGPAGWQEKYLFVRNDPPTLEQDVDLVPESDPTP